MANTLQNSVTGVGISGALLSSILKKRNSSAASSGAGAMTNHSSQHSSRAGSLEDLSGSSWGALDPTGSGGGGVKSILKKGTSSNVGTGMLALDQVFFAT